MSEAANGVELILQTVQLLERASRPAMRSPSAWTWLRRSPRSPRPASVLAICCWVAVCACRVSSGR